MATANCPSCGGPIVFAIGSSIVVVCEHCRSVVARTDVALESLGKVAQLIDTGSPLRQHLPGRFRNVGFRLTGRTQMRNDTGAVWDEWYAAFDDGRWGWLAEAQGKYYITFEEEGAKVPPVNAVPLGTRVGDLIVHEIGHAELIAAEGEIPWRAEPGYSYVYADLSGQGQQFGTIDYSEDPPLLFRGHQTTLDQLGIDVGERRAGAPVGVATLNCSNCGGRLDLIAPDQSERIVCPNCGGMHDVSQGKLEFLKVLKRKKINPVIPLGSSGTIDGDKYVVAGFMQRSVKFDQTYYWTEYLLYNPARGFRWLVHSDDHWSFVEGINAAEVVVSGKHAHYGGHRYRLFQDSRATVTYVVGEFPWKVTQGEHAAAADYIRPPFGLSREVTKVKGGGEINWSHARYLTPEEVEKAFNVKDLPQPVGVGSMQPYPGSDLNAPWAIFLILMLLVAAFFAVTRPNRVVHSQTYELAAEGGEWGSSNDRGRVFFTDPFELSGKYNVAIEANANADNNWVYVAADLVNQSTNRMESFALPIEYYHGVDGGSRWSEGSTTKRAYVSAPPKGKYAMRIETQWNATNAPTTLRITVREGVFRFPHFLLAFFAISFFPIIGLLRQFSWEKKRWAESAFNPYESLSSDDEDEE